MTLEHDRLAFDRATVRTMDVDGRLHVEVSNISKAAVNPYLGSEIPGAEQLGLDQNRIYQLLRDPAELEKAAPTFNNIPLLNQHIPVSADDHQPDAVVGATGSDAEFIAPFLRNSLVVWESVAIAGINSRQQCELSAAYRYVPVMTPGVFEGQAYDGIMTQIIGNHVALVEVGRAGSDVVVGDSNPFNLEIFDMKKASRKAIAVRAVLGAYLRPKLAQDAAIGDLGALVRDVRAATQEQDLARISRDVLKACAGKLAADMEMEPKELHGMMKAAADDVPDEEIEAMDEDEKRDDETQEEYEKRMKEKAEKTAKDEESEEDEEKAEKEKDTKAMDAAISAAVAKTEKATILRMNAIRQAEKDVAPFVGEVAAQDSAEAVYRIALDAAGVDLEGVHPSAFRAIIKNLPIPGSAPKKIAQDSASNDDFLKIFPTAKFPNRS